MSFGFSLPCLLLNAFLDPTVEQRPPIPKTSLYSNLYTLEASESAEPEIVLSELFVKLQVHLDPSELVLLSLPASLSGGQGEPQELVFFWRDQIYLLKKRADGSFEKRELDNSSHLTDRDAKIREALHSMVKRIGFDPHQAFVEMRAWRAPPVSFIEALTFPEGAIISDGRAREILTTRATVFWNQQLLVPVIGARQKLRALQRLKLILTSAGAVGLGCATLLTAL